MIDMLKGSSGRRQVFLVALFTTIISAQGGSADCASLPGTAQSATATLSGTTLDESGAAVSEVRITAARVDTGTIYLTTTNANGYFAIALLPPGRYKVTAQHQGFATVDINDVLLNVNDQRALTIQLKLGELKEGITIEGVPVIQTESASVSTIVDRQFVENLPLNGRSFHTLLELAPGVVMTGGRGLFSVNGQRDNANYLIVDGISANLGIDAFGNALGQTAGGTVPALTALGGTNNLVSVDALQEFRVQTSTYEAEYGRSPGAQLSVVTRSGTNQFHGSLFDYVRNDALDANDWFANSKGLKKPPLRQNDFGGVLNGPVIRGGTFFFLSYEGLRLRQPRTLITQVPSLDLRRTAPQQMQPYLNVFPIPNGRDLGGGFAELFASYSDPATLNATSVRIDHTLNGKVQLFGRWSYAPSQTESRMENGAAGLFRIRPETRTLTFGSTQAITSEAGNEFRINYTRSAGHSSFVLDDFGGAVPLQDSALFPSFASSKDSQFNFVLGPIDWGPGLGADNLQRQVNVIDNVSLTAGTHLLKLGIDYRRLSPVFHIWKYNQVAIFDSASDIFQQKASQVAILANAGAQYLSFTNFSAYAQDTWKIKRRLVLSYGVRWDINTPPSEKNGNNALTVIGLDNPPTMTLAPRGTRLWNTSYDNFAPRLGLVYQLYGAQGREAVVRGGFGLYYDLGTGAAGSAFTNLAIPYFARRDLFNVSFPLNPQQASMPTFALNPPYGLLSVFEPGLELPRTYQWNISVEQSLGSSETITASYVGAAGRRLLRRGILAGPSLGNPNFTRVLVTTNGDTSDYDALQLQFQRRLSHGLQAQVAYTWSHSVDTASSELSSNLPLTVIEPGIDRASSNFDVRHSLTAAVTYDFPRIPLNGIPSSILRNWSADAIFRTRTGTPVNVLTTSPLFGVFAVTRPDLVTGVPLYLSDRSVAGGRRINRAAFSVPPAGRQGNLGRNALRGFSLSQVDVSIRRRLDLQEGISLQLSGEFFNLLNHPNFADPVGSLASPFFGQSIFMLNQNLGSFNPIYQIGGPRSIQLAAKLQF